MQNYLRDEPLAGRTGGVNRGNLLRRQGAIVKGELVNATREEEGAISVFDIGAQKQGPGIVGNRSVAESERDRYPIDIQHLLPGGIIKGVGYVVPVPERRRERRAEDSAKSAIVANRRLKDSVFQPDA